MFFGNLCIKLADASVSVFLSELSVICFRHILLSEVLRCRVCLLFELEPGPNVESVVREFVIAVVHAQGLRGP